mgnify:CR=1 FL=1
MTAVAEHTISEVENQIRDLVNGARRKHGLLNERASWHQLCSSLDVIGDTELALDSYLAAPEPEGAGPLYIFIYRLDDYFAQSSGAALNDRDAFIFVSFV